MHKQFINSVDGMFIDPADDIFEPIIRIDIIDDTSADQAIDHCQSFSAFLTAGVRPRSTNTRNRLTSVGRWIHYIANATGQTSAEKPEGKKLFPCVCMKPMTNLSERYLTC